MAPSFFKFMKKIDRRNRVDLLYYLLIDGVANIFTRLSYFTGHS